MVQRLIESGLGFDGQDTLLPQDIPCWFGVGGLYGGLFVLTTSNEPWTSFLCVYCQENLELATAMLYVHWPAVVLAPIR